jgi:polysaccharide export outer membrane protein
MGKFRLYSQKYIVNRSFLLSKSFFIIIIFAFILPLIGCAANRVTSDGEVTLSRTTFSFDRETYSYDLFPEYHLMPGDVLDVLYQIRTWVRKESFKISVDNVISIKFVYNPELNETQMVRPDGRVSLPYLGEVYVLGKSVAELTKELKERYSKILQDPEIYVVVPEFRSAIKELKTDLHTAPRGLSRLVTVRPDGYVTFPIVGDIFVANKTIPEVDKLLNDMYEKMLPGVHCDLFLERHSGSLVYVLGEVKSPGAYKIIKPISILHALTLAGSYVPGAKLNNVIVIRKHEDKMVAKRINLKNILSLKSGSKMFYLEPDDILYVPKTRITKTAELFRAIGDIIFFRGWNLGLSWELHDEAPSGNR